MMALASPLNNPECGASASMTVARLSVSLTQEAPQSLKSTYRDPGIGLYERI